MLSKITVLQIVLVVTTISCELNRDKRGRRKNTDFKGKSLWKKEYEDELSEAMLSTKKRENYTRVPQSNSLSDNEAVIEKLMETVTSSEKYFKKIDSIDFRLNRLDIEVHEKTNSILKQLSTMAKAGGSNGCSEKLSRGVEEMKVDLNHIKSMLEKNLSQRATNREDSASDHIDVALDTRLGILESNLKSIQTGVDAIVTTISDVKNRQQSKTFPSANLRADISTSLDTMALITEFRKTLHDQKSKKCDCKSSRVDRSERYPSDCHEIQVQGFNVSGIYKIRPDDMDPFYVLCDLTTAGGGWTVFQNRFDGSQDFYKGWHDYEYGFGNLAGEFWLGLEKLNFLTNQKLYELRIEMESLNGQDAYAGYSVFTIGSQHEGYRISTLGTFYGTAGDSLAYHAGQKFSTFDVDNDEWKDGACATEHGGAWWYKECDKSNLNGKYTQGEEENRGQSIYWISFKGPNTPLSKTKMMIRPLPASNPIDYTEGNRKILEGSKLRRPQNKLAVTADQISTRSGSNVMGHDTYSQYRYEEPVVDTFLSNYA